MKRKKAGGLSDVMVSKTMIKGYGKCAKVERIEMREVF